MRSAVFDLSYAVDLDECVCGHAPKGQLVAGMGYLPGRGQNTNLTWKAASDQDEDGHPSPALRRPHASNLADPGLPVRPRSDCPPSDLLTTAFSESIPVYETAASDVSILPDDTNPFGHIRSSMGRLILQNSGGMSRKMPLRVIRDTTAGEHAEGDNRFSKSASDGNSGSASLPETRPPISIRSHIAAQLKGPDQDRNGMRIRRSHEFGRPETASAKDLGIMRMENNKHHLSTNAREMEDKGRLPEHGNVASYIRQRKQRPAFGGPPKFPINEPDWSHDHRPTIQKFVTFHCCRPAIKPTNRRLLCPTNVAGS